MGKAKLISLQKVFWRFLIILISGLFLSVAIPFLLLALASNAGYVTYYNILYTNMDVTEQSIKIYKNWRKQWPHKQDAISIHTEGRRILCIKILCRLTV